MKDKYAKRQINAAIDNVESALRELSNRLEEAVPGRKRARGRIARAEAGLRRTAHSVAARLPRERTTSLIQSAEQSVRTHPVKVALTAAIAGYCAWSVFRYANERTAVRKERLGQPYPFGDAAEASRRHADVHH